jgi:uncharacterized protein (UPF0264 family)
VKLLVSVADAVEAHAALLGGADIIDAKDPTRGALGPVAPGALRAIRETVPAEVPFSAALGEVRLPEEVSALFDGIDVPLSFVKLGIRGPDAGNCRRSISAAVDRASQLPERPGLVLVAFADTQGVDGLSLAEMADLAIRSGAQGLLVDTARKASGSLFDFCTSEELQDLRSTLPAGFSFAVAGSLRSSHIVAAIDAGADVMGVRGAACESGRASPVSSAAVARLVEKLRAPSTGKQLLQALELTRSDHSQLHSVR